MSRDQLQRYVLPALALVLALAAWEAVVRINNIPPVILPAPSLIFITLIKDWPPLFNSLLVTLSITVEALVAATIGGTMLALVFAQFKTIERAFFPFAVIMQVTPVVSIAPLLLVYLSSGGAVLVCSFLVAFFPILSNTALGLSSVDHNLLDLFQLYRASRGRQLLWLRVPSALPYFLGGLRIGGGLALIGAIVAEIAAGSAGQGSGLAFRIIESGYRLNIPRMFAALTLISLTGIFIFLVLSALSYVSAASLARQRQESRVMSRRESRTVSGAFAIAKTKRWALDGARLLSRDLPATDAQGFAKADILIDEGRIAAIVPQGYGRFRRCAAVADGGTGRAAAVRRRPHPSRQGPFLAPRAQSDRELRGRDPDRDERSRRALERA